ncbi:MULTISPECIES: hypothetical protein [Prauserella salsuginis group]|uniref:Uncharacterized protein n=2 Tax=Prauserella salsuginis group TaxID=2893672 RepID=A0A839XRI2_9PSEU|nr:MULTISPECIES: hypothetical protein [Prauserella salsuginis group]MBB3663233.1 hypothetical protein [Prauserella sediminis]MCR3720940.1 hypothetical protein [Prauserella flava]MCR3734979.1 hypothetical protein [Prauserella salsuginis]
MKSGFARTVAAVLSGAALAVSTSGIATAASISDDGSGSVTTQSSAHRLLDLRDQLTDRAYSGDVQGTKATLTDIDPVLERLAATPAQRKAASDAKKALTQNEKVQDVLADPQAQPRAYTADAEMRQLPALPDPLAAVNGLLQSLLATVQGLLSGLLGPVPMPEVPEVPDAPDAPEVPDVPAP